MSNLPPTLEQVAVQPAPLLRRTAAFLIDLLLLNLLTVLLALTALGGMALGLRQAGQPLPSRDLVFSLAEFITAGWPLLTIGYFGYFTGRGGQTPGKMALRIMVVTTHNTAVGWWQAWWRAAIVTASLPLFAIYAMAALTPKGRALHDYLAGTRVIRRPEPSRWPATTTPADSDVSSIPAQAAPGMPTPS